VLLALIGAAILAFLAWLAIWEIERARTAPSEA
jgi:hypothetical protein